MGLGFRKLWRRYRRHPWGPRTLSEMVSEGIVSVGRGTYGADLIKVHNFRAPDGRWLGARLRIGAYCSIAPCEIFLGGNHHMEWTSQYPFRSIWNLENRDEDGWGKGDITIGNDVWIGNASVLLSGVTIGDGAVIGARAVVSRDVNPYAVVVGNPAREVKRRFDEATVKHLLDLRWWDWPEDRIRASLSMLLAPPDCGNASSVDVLKLGEQPLAFPTPSPTPS